MKLQTSSLILSFGILALAAVAPEDVSSVASAFPPSSPRWNRTVTGRGIRRPSMDEARSCRPSWSGGYWLKCASISRHICYAANMVHADHGIEPRRPPAAQLLARVSLNVVPWR